jgi:hypothetical protein
MKKGVVPRPGIDTEMQDGAIAIPTRDGFSDINYIYNMYNRRYIVVPLTAADVTTAIMYQRQ